MLRFSRQAPIQEVLLKRFAAGRSGSRLTEVGRSVRWTKKPREVPPDPGGGPHNTSRRAPRSRHGASSSLIPPCRILADPAGVAQLVEHHLAKVRVAGSSPVARSSKTPW